MNFIGSQISWPGKSLCTEDALVTSYKMHDDSMRQLELLDFSYEQGIWCTVACYHLGQKSASMSRGAKRGESCKTHTQFVDEW